MSKDNRFYCFDDDILIDEKSLKTNGGPGSGNYNPGQGRGVGKPASGSSKRLTYEEYSERFKKATRSEKEELDKEYPEYADRYFKELVSRHIQKEKDEKSFKVYEKDNSHPHFDLDKIPTDFKNALDISPAEGLRKYDSEKKEFVDAKSRKEYYNEEKGVWVKVRSMSPRDYARTIIENNNGHYTSMSEIERRTSEGGIKMYVDKFNNRERQEVPYIKFNKEGKFSGEQEGFHRSFAAEEVGDSEIPVLIVTDYYGKQPSLNHGRDITKDVEEYLASKSKKNSLTRNQRLDLIRNGGPGSGNFNPGQGQGVGKPANGSVRKFEYDFNANPADRSGILTNDYMDYLLNNKELGVKVDDEKIKELFEKKCWHKEKFKDLEDYKDKLIHLQIQKEGGNISDAADFQRMELQDMIRNKVLYSDSGTFEALAWYVDGASSTGYGKRGKEPRKRFDEKYGISKFIDKNPALNYGDKPIYRGLTTTDDFLYSLKVGDKVDMRGVSSWTADETEATLFLSSSLVQNGTEKVIFENVQKDKKNTMIYPISNQTEILSSGSNQCRVVNIEERETPIKGGSHEKAVYITVEFD